MNTVMCAAMGTASRQYGLEAGTFYGDCTVCSCKHSNSSVWIRNILLCIEAILCAAVGTASHQHGLETLYFIWRPYCVQL